MSRYLNPFLVQQRLNQLGLKLFTLNDFQVIFGVSEIAAKKFTEKYTKKGILIRLKRGLFMLKDNAPSQYAIANKLYEPSYISFDTALSFHGIIPESIYALTSATTKATRNFEILGASYHYYKVKKSVFTGYRPEKHAGETVLIAEPEKALADLLYFAALKKREFHYERVVLSRIQKTKLLTYIKMFNRPRMLGIMEEMYALSGDNQGNH